MAPTQQTLPLKQQLFCGYLTEIVSTEINPGSFFICGAVRLTSGRYMPRECGGMSGIEFANGELAA